MRPALHRAADAVAELLAQSEDCAATQPAADRDLVRVYLQPGQVFATAEPRSVMTILGSCVAICVCDRVTGVGGVNHYLLPHWAGEGAASPRFGNVAVAELVDRVVGLGGAPSRLSAKVFGGACVLEAFRARPGHLGEKNVQIAFRLLAERGI